MEQSVYFWVIDGSFLKAKSDNGKTNRFKDIGNLVHHINISDAILVSHYDFERQASHITSIGTIEDIDINSEAMVLKSIECDFVITPSPQGRVHWKKFCFALDANRVHAYKLPTEFSNVLNDPAWLDIGIKDHSQSHYKPDSKPSLHVEEGFVYIFQWNDEFKIGKSIDPDRRIKEIKRTTGRDSKEIHRIFSTDYTKAERWLHKHFEKKRAPGKAGIEWFQLDPEDVEWLRSVTIFEDFEDEIS